MTRRSACCAGSVLLERAGSAERLVSRYIPSMDARFLVQSGQPAAAMKMAP